MDISCNGQRNVLLNISLISSLLLKMALYVLGYLVGINFIAWYPNFRLYILYSVKFGINIFTGCGLCQDTISTCKLSIDV